ncbi:sulfatase [Chloroflexota bacterium]
MTRWRCLREHLGQGMGAGLAAAVILSLTEVALFAFVDQTVLTFNVVPVWRPLIGLPYALIAYGLLGLLAGLGIGLLPALWCAWRVRSSRASYFTWDVVAVLLVSVGTFVAVANCWGREMQNRPSRVDMTAPDVASATLLLVTMISAWCLLLLLVWFARRTRLSRSRWSVGLYLAVLAVVLAGSGTLRLATALADQSPRVAGVAPDLEGRPNTLFIVLDSLRADHVSCYGYEENDTLHIDALARDGVLYRNMTAQSSWTKPSVATMLASLYPSSHQAVSGRHWLPDAVTTLPEVLQVFGYRTAGFTTNPHVSSVSNFQQGYDEYEYLPPDYAFFASPTSSRFFVHALFGIVRNFFVAPTAHHHNEYYQDAETLGARALAWLEANREGRFFLYLHYMDPHEPYFAHPYDGTSVSMHVTRDPPPAQAAFMRQLYDGDVAFVDGHLGELFDQLKAWGLYDDMLIILTSDHGEEFYEHGGWWHGHTLYEEVIAVPLIIKYPASAHAGAVDTGLARGLDIAPTVLDVIEYPSVDAMQGVSLRPGTATRRAELSLAELGAGGAVRAIQGLRYKLIVVDEDYPQDLPTEALFDLQIDPGEQKNLAPNEPAMLQSLHVELGQVVVAAEDQAVASQSGEMDAITQEQLRKLGY